MEIVVNLFRHFLENLGLGDRWSAFVDWYQADSKHRRVLFAVGLMLVTLFVVAVYACSGPPQDISEYVWVYDEESGELDAIHDSEVDEDTVIARVYKDAEGNQIIAWLVRGDAIRSVETGWVATSSEEGRRIPKDFATRHGGGIEILHP